MRSFTGRRSVRWSTTAVVLTVLTTGCTAQQEPDGPAVESPVSSAATPPGASPSPSPSGGAGGQRDDDATPPVGDVPAEPVAAVPGQEPGAVLEVYRLARSGQTATLTMAVLNDGPNPLSFNTSFQAETNDLDASGISLLDPVGLQRYLVLRDTEGACLCSNFRSAATRDPGERVFFSASFPAPPADVTAVTVETPAGSLVDVPLTEAS